MNNKTEKKGISLTGGANRYLLIAAATSIALMSSTVVTFAAGNIFTTISNTLKEFYVAFAGLNTGIFALMFLINLLRVYIASGQEQFHIWGLLKKYLFVWAVIMCMGTLIAYGESLFAGQGWNGGN